MFKTIITHFFNEEYLLPWWLKHHKQFFDHGVLIDYQSTDRSVDIIKEICPEWTVVPSANQMFDAQLCDEEVSRYENQIEGWKICLNVTEFLVGDFTILNDQPNQQLIIPCNVMVDLEQDNIPSHNTSLLKQKPFGIKFDQGGSSIRRPRCVHNKQNIQYPLGRHFSNHTTDKLQVCWFGWSPFNNNTIKRKLQIQTKIPESDKARGFGREHLTTEDKLNQQFLILKNNSRRLEEFV